MYEIKYVYQIMTFQTLIYSHHILEENLSINEQKSLHV